MIPNDRDNPGPARDPNARPHDCRDQNVTNPSYCKPTPPSGEFRTGPVHLGGNMYDIRPLDPNDPLRMVEVNKGLLDKLVEDSKLLSAMRRHGVHHWDGYAAAVEYVYFNEGKKNAK